jgi:putative membrane protein
MNAPRHLFLGSVTMLLSACNQTSGVEGDSPVANGSATVAKHYEGPKPEGVSSPNDAVTTTFYIPQSAISDMYEIEAGQLAQVRARAPEVKAFAKMMVADHMKSSGKLRQFVADHPVNIAIPKNIDARRSAMLANLKNAGDAEFDAVYVGQQAAAHDEAYNLQSSYASRGDYAELKAFARETAKIVAHHRRQAKALDSKFGSGATSVPAGR